MPRKQVAIIIHEGVQALDVAGPVDVFAEANNFLPQPDHYETLLLAKDEKPIRASNGMRMAADRGFDEAQQNYDVLLAAGGPALPGAARDDVLCDWLAGAAPQCSLYGSICTGAFLFGHAGLLDGHNVTTHWQNAARLAESFPEAKVDYDRIYLRDGRLVTSAGVTAGIDLALALVAEDHGPQVSLKVAKRLVVVAQRQGGQSQFSPFLTAPAKDGSPIARVQAHVMEHIADAFPVEKLAEIAGMSPRNFARQFVEETGVTPHEFIERARVDVARNLLEGSDLALKAVAYHSGFSNPDRMRIVFAKRLGVSPAQYRASFQRE
ncbi:GlxA family transcriptional regulator [Dongia soli]|uniref:GlxA family transcriptional regulator n=1 Tax=Dongia soli TaxID=600628 RepID=A0ABU5EEE4_9PROT|nr:GlxA family transcriptional regulator [Dongia soli]MDY0884729.1 GlxA family transcriptional regulator [Dongia soli]